MPQKKEALKEIRTGLLSRGLSLAKASFKAGGLAARGWLNPDGQSPAWLGKVELLIQELGQLKGTAMKVGQTLSMYGEHLLPKEVNELLKTLQQDSPPLEWRAIRQILLAELGEAKLAELEIDEQPTAAASIGQVHRARVKATGQDVAIKVQYPGVADAVETDLKLLKFILNVSDLVPRGPRFDQIFNEIREMFHQEINYASELEFGERFATLLAGDDRYIIPKPLREFSTPRVLTTTFVPGERPDSPAVQGLSQERRNRVGMNYFDLYLRELFEFRLVQTDPHLGNYRVQIDPNGNDRLVLFDFGAVRDVPETFLKCYFELVHGGAHRNARDIERGGRKLGLLLPEDPIELVDDYIKLCFLLTEPFALPEWKTAPESLLDAEGNYDWGGSDLPKRVANGVTKIAGSYKLRAPPRELVFLDRKLGGVFVFLSVLKCKMNARPRLMQAIEANQTLRD